MSVDYVVCAACADTFPDCSPFVICSNCEEWICEDCVEEQTKKYGKVDSKSDEAFFLAMTL